MPGRATLDDTAPVLAFTTDKPRKGSPVPAEERELWAWCGPCARWFFVPKSDAPRPDNVTCPVCSEHPRQFEGRDPNAAASEPASR